MYEKQSQIIKEKLNMKTSPVAVKIYDDLNDAKIDLTEFNEEIIHCQAIITASKGTSFYKTKNNFGCPLGMCDLGLEDFDDDFFTGEYFNKVNIAKDINDAKYLANKVPKMNKKIEAIGYMPLEQVKNSADVLVIIAKPKQIFDVIRANTYMTGKRIECDVSGTQSLCGDIVVDTYQENKTKISFGCIGSHFATELQEYQVIISIPFNQVDNFVDSLEKTYIG